MSFKPFSKNFLETITKQKKSKINYLLSIKSNRTRTKTNVHLFYV